jgi:glycogen debranching enzyme
MVDSDQESPISNPNPDLNAIEQHQRKQRVLTQATPSITDSIADALVMKNDNIFFLCKPNGDVPLTANHGYGLYYHDCRYLSGYQVRLAHTQPTVLVSSARTGFSSIIQLANPEITTASGIEIHRDDVGVRWERILDGSRNKLCDRFTVENFSQRQVEFPLSMAFLSRFEDIFAVRGILPVELGKRLPTHWQNQSLIFEYSGADGLFRCMTIHFSPYPEHIHGQSAEFAITLGPRQSKDILITLCVSESLGRPESMPEPATVESAQAVGRDFLAISAQWQEEQMEIECKLPLTRELLHRSLTDLRTLRTSLDGQHYFAAGVPWFSTLFGRDSILTSLQMLAVNPGIAAETLRLLARFQARDTSDWHDSQPGKILHELREGELAHLNEIPHTPYYGSVDSTPLFLLLLARSAEWTGTLDLFQELRPNVDAALDWIDRYGDSNGDGYIDYTSLSAHGLANQGWKDSGNAIANADGSLTVPPIALPEVQGYVYRARLGIAGLFERAGDPARAESLRAQADDLRRRFNRDFWSERIGTYVLALQAGGRPAEVVASNAGQVLWTGIADPDKAGATVRRMMAADLFNGWGIRTLSSQAENYNPSGYHLGSVWPFDNGLIVAGFRRYGFDQPAWTVITAMFESARQFDVYRLPELFSGFDREEYEVPVHYPVACHPQAWSAGALPYALTTLLGLVPDGFNHRLKIVRPLLPEEIGPIEIRSIAVGGAHADLIFTPSVNGTAEVKVLVRDGDLEVDVISGQGEYDF